MSIIMLFSMIAINLIVLVECISAQPCGKAVCSMGQACCQPNLCCMPSTSCEQRILGSCYDFCLVDAVMCEEFTNACCPAGNSCDLVNWTCVQTSNPLTFKVNGQASTSTTSSPTPTSFTPTTPPTPTFTNIQLPQVLQFSIHVR